MCKSIWIKHWSEFEKFYDLLDEGKVEEVKNWYNAASLKMDFKGISALISTEGLVPALVMMPMPVKSQ